ncbi:MAG: transposase [Moorea sp. SIO2B7]|nr:transposase [Moorena sp. SIO2B7]
MPTNTNYVFEDLKVKTMMARCQPTLDEQTENYLHNGQAAKSGLNKVIADAAWGTLKQKVRVIAERWSKLVVEVNPQYSSQECSQCGYLSPKNRDKEKFLCENCGYCENADIQASRNILEPGLKKLAISLPKLPGVPRKVMPQTRFKEISSPLGEEPGNPVQLELFQGREGKAIFPTYLESSSSRKAGRGVRQKPGKNTERSLASKKP